MSRFRWLGYVSRRLALDSMRNPAENRLWSDCSKRKLQMTGFFEPSELGNEERIVVRRSFARALNRILARSERCCSVDNDISISNVCFYDYTGCISMILKSRPQDCGDGESAFTSLAAMAVALMCLCCAQARISTPRSVTMGIRRMATVAPASAVSKRNFTA